MDGRPAFGRKRPEMKIAPFSSATCRRLFGLCSRPCWRPCAQHLQALRRDRRPDNVDRRQVRQGAAVRHDQVNGSTGSAIRQSRTFGMGRIVAALRER